MRHILPCGAYFIGDVIHVLSPHHISKMTSCKGMFHLKTIEGNHFDYVVAPTAFGNGTFIGSDGREFIVRHKCIGMVPIYLLDDEQFDGYLYEFNNAVQFEWNRGIFTITSIDFNLVINTRD